MTGNRNSLFGVWQIIVNAIIDLEFIDSGNTLLEVLPAGVLERKPDDIDWCKDFARLIGEYPIDLKMPAGDRTPLCLFAALHAYIVALLDEIEAIALELEMEKLYEMITRAKEQSHPAQCILAVHYSRRQIAA